MFNREKRKRMELLQDFRPTSKIQLKQFCQWFYGGDIKKAQELYEYYAKDIELPDFDPVPPSWQQQVKDNANGFMSWLKENQGTLTQWYDFVRQIIANKGVLPNIAETAEEVAAPLEDINQ